MKILFSILLVLMLATSCSVKKAVLDEQKYAQIANQSGADLHYKADLDSKSAKHISQGTIVTVYQATENKMSFADIGSSKLYKVKTRSGIEGWTFGKFISFIDEETARKKTLDEINKLSIILSTQLIDTVNATERADNSRTFVKLQYSEIESISGTENLGLLKCTVITYLKGSILGINKYRINYTVTVELSDIDNLSDSAIKILNITRGSDKDIEVIPEQKNSNIVLSDLIKAFGADKFNTDKSE